MENLKYFLDAMRNSNDRLTEASKVLISLILYSSHYDWGACTL